jgi:hypothetical protein
LIRLESTFAALVNARREADADVSRDVAAIIAASARAAMRRCAIIPALRSPRSDASGWEIDRADPRAALDGLDPVCAPRSNSQPNGSPPITTRRSPPIATESTRPASASARAGMRSMRPGSTCPAAARPIPRRC